MKPLFQALARLPLSLLRVALYLLTFRFITELVAWVRELCALRRREKQLRDSRRGRPLHCTPRCATVRPEVYKRADPLIYSQGYLMEQGLAVTWDNPDIQLFDAGVPVPSTGLQAGKTYQVVATVYNNSTDAPAVGLPVKFAFQSFGVGAALTEFDVDTIDLPVKGAPDHPAKARATWTTPSTPGHYCLRVELIWPDDANPKNNVGQENTDVGIAASPAAFKFVVRNDDTITKRIQMTADSYTIPQRLSCDKRPTKQQSDRRHPDKRRRKVFVPPLEAQADWTLARVRHDVQAFPVPAGWSVQINPPAFALPPTASVDVFVHITPPDSFHGEKPFNINAMHAGALLGGVTLTVRR
jgi:hypothetical protein